MQVDGAPVTGRALADLPAQRHQASIQISTEICRGERGGGSPGRSGTSATAGITTRGPASRPRMISAPAVTVNVGSGLIPSHADTPPIPAPASPAML